MRSRKTLLILVTAGVLAAGVLAATLPGEEPPPLGPSPWSKPVDGIRAKLSTDKPVYKIGEPILLRLDIQNLGDKAISLEKPNVMPLISYPNQHPYTEKHAFDWVLTAEQPNVKVQICWGQREVVKRAHAVMLLKPGEMHTVLITARTDAKGEQEEKKGDAKDGEGRKREPQKVDASFVPSHDPGRYTLKATFETRNDKDEARDPKDGRWKASRLETLPISIQLLPGPREKAED